MFSVKGFCLFVCFVEKHVHQTTLHNVGWALSVEGLRESVILPKERGKSTLGLQLQPWLFPGSLFSIYTYTQLHTHAHHWFSLSGENWLQPEKDPILDSETWNFYYHGSQQNQYRLSQWQQKRVTGRLREPIF